MQKIKLVIYYGFVQYLPHSRTLGLATRFRVWYLSKVLKIMPSDKNSKVETRVYISNAKHLKIGKHVRINEQVFLQGEISIGDYSMLAPNVAIYTKTHVYDNPNVPMVTAGETPTKPVVLEEDVWLGRNVVVLPGVTIGKGSIVGANSLVNKNVAPYSIMGGVPARLIRSRK